MNARYVGSGLLLLIGYAGFELYQSTARARTDKATSDDAPAVDTADRYNWSPSSSSEAVDAEVAPFSPDAAPPPEAAPSRGPGDTTASALDSAGREWALAGELDVSMQPLPEGLYARTTELWESPDFLALTNEEAHALLPTDDAMPAKMPGSLLDALGTGLPTIEDCQQALRDPKALELFTDALAAELTLYALQEAPPAAARARAIEIAHEICDEADELLYERLDRVSGFHNWSLLARLFREMSK